MLEILALTITFKVWWILTAISVISFIVWYIISPPPVNGYGIMPIPDFTGAFYFLINVILNLIMWMIYFIIV